jgi:hypothetical protein
VSPAKALKLLERFGIGLVMALAGLVGAAVAKDLWVHPRGEVFNPAIHYRAADGEVFYKQENDLGRAIGDIRLQRGAQPLVTLTLGRDLFDKIDGSRGSMVPVLLWDSDGDGRVDRSAIGRIEGSTGIFDSPDLANVNLELDAWQLGVRYIAGAGGDRALDGRYLASVASQDARIAFIRDEAPEEYVEEGPEVAIEEPPAAPGLVILRHRVGVPFDLAAFEEDPGRYIEDFDRLSRGADGDDWTAMGGAEEPGSLLTRFSDEDLFIVRTEGGARLEVEWGDMPWVAFFEEYLAVPADEDGCYSSLNTTLEQPDGSPVTIPHRFFYCPEDSVALLDIPDGYQVGLSAHVDEELIERTDAGNSIMDNVRLYAKEIYPRSPLNRSTGTVTGNIRAGFVDAGQDAKDVFKYAITGVQATSVHTGQQSYRASPITAGPRAIWSLVTLDPFKALDELANGVDSVVQVGASAVSGVQNAVVNPLVQATVGAAASPDTADRAAHWIGAFTQAAAKNLPGGERSTDAFSIDGVIHHNRAFEPKLYTRTDLQLNVDRVMTVVDAAIIQNAMDDSDSDGGGEEGGNGDMEGGNGGGGMEPGDMEPGGMDPGGMDPGGMMPGGMEPGGMMPGGMDPGGMDPGGMDPGDMKKVFKKKVFKKKVVKKQIAKKQVAKKQIAKKQVFKKKIVKKQSLKKALAKKQSFKKSFSKKVSIKKRSFSNDRVFKQSFSKKVSIKSTSFQKSFSAKISIKKKVISNPGISFTKTKVTSMVRVKERAAKTKALRTWISGYGR